MLRAIVAAAVWIALVSCRGDESQDRIEDQSRDVGVAPAMPPMPAGRAAGSGAPGGAPEEQAAGFAGSDERQGQAGDASTEIGLAALSRQVSGTQGTPTAGQPQGGTDPGAAMIIRTGRATVEVDSLEAAVANVQALALRVGGYIANISMQTGRTQLRQGTLEIKVPAQRFDEAVEGLRPFGRLLGLEVSAQDVGEEYVDLGARMASARRLEERLITLLASRTGRLEEVLAVERELARVRQEIERYEGRMRYLRTRAAMSTLYVTVHEPAPIITANMGRNPIVIAFRNAWRNFVGFLAVLIESLGVVIPVAVVVAVIVLWWRRFRAGRVVAVREGGG